MGCTVPPCAVRETGAYDSETRGRHPAALGAPFSGTLAPIDGGEEQAGPGASGDGFLYSVLDYYPEGPKLMVNGTELVWRTSGLTPLTIPSPVAGDGMVFVTSGFNGAALKAISLVDARGDVTGTGSVVWSHDRDTPYVSSPLLYGGALYFTKYVHGILSVFDARAGTPHYGPQRVEGLRGVMASPVAADGRVYLTGRDGTTVVIRHGRTYEVLATNKLDDQFSASMALVGGDIYMRGDVHLYCIAES